MDSYELAMRRERRAKRRREQRLRDARGNTVSELAQVAYVIISFWLMFYIVCAVMQAVSP